MPEPQNDSNEVAGLKQRLQNLAAEKSNVELVVRMITNLSEVSGLESLVDHVLKSIMDTVGGTNIIIMYRYDEAFCYSDVFGEKKTLQSIEDELISKTFKEGCSQIVESSYNNTGMTYPIEDSQAFTWVYPLKIHSEIIGVLKIENSTISSKGISLTLPVFFNYAAQVMKNEIQNTERLQKAYDELTESTTKLQHYKDHLEELVDQRTAELQNSERKFRTLFESSSDSILLLDVEGGYIDCNPAALQMFAMPSKEALMQMSPSMLSPVYQPDGTPSAELANIEIAKALEEGVHSFEWLHRGLDGREFPCTVLATRIQMDGKVILHGTVRDITERKRSEAELEKANAYISNIIDSMPSILVGVDSGYAITLWNKEAERASGVSSEQARGQRISKIFPRLEGEIGNIQQAMDTGEVCTDLALPYEEDGRSYYENITIYPLIIDNFQTAVVRIDDVTERYELESQLNQARKMDAIGQLAGGIAHDFNNMLAAIIGASELLMYPKVGLNEIGVKYVDMIFRAAERAADLTGKLLAFGRKGKRTHEAMDVHDILTDAMVILNNTIDKRVAISLDTRADNSIVTGDNTALQNVIINMGINASHAMPNGGELQITTRNLIFNYAYCKVSPFDIAPGNYLDIMVRDTGTGIASENLDRIFEPFFTTKEQGKGTGLGLAAAFGTIQDHHGAITVYSEVGDGTVFHIYLPCAGVDVNKSQPETKVVKGAGVILLVDDEEDIRVMGESILQGMGYQVLTAANGIECVELFKKHCHSIDLVLMDMIMPVMNGEEAFRQLKQIDRHCKIVIASGFTKDDRLAELQRDGLSGFIQKPYRSVQLSQLLTEVLGQENAPGSPD